MMKLLSMPATQRATPPLLKRDANRANDSCLTLLPQNDKDNGSGGGFRGTGGESDGHEAKKTTAGGNRKRPMACVDSRTGNKAAKYRGEYNNTNTMVQPHPFRAPFELYYKYRELQELRINGRAALIALGWLGDGASLFPNWQQSRFAIALRKEWQSLGRDARKPFQSASSIDRHRFDAEMERFRANVILRRQSNTASQISFVQLV